MSFPNSLFSHFKTISVNAFQQQQQCLLQQSVVSISEQTTTKLSHRRPGRPKRPVPLLPPSDTTSDSSYSQQTQTTTEKKCRIDWFSSPYIHDILDAICRTHNITDAIHYLQQKYPKLPTETEARFVNLKRQTIEYWFDDNFELKPKYQKILEDGKQNKGGFPSFIASFPSLNEKISSRLKEMRKNNVTCTVRIISMIIKSVIKKEQPEVLNTFKISDSWIKNMD